MDWVHQALDHGGAGSPLIQRFDVVGPWGPGWLPYARWVALGRVIAASSFLGSPWKQVWWQVGCNGRSACHMRAGSRLILRCGAEAAELEQGIPHRETAYPLYPAGLSSTTPQGQGVEKSRVSLQCIAMYIAMHRNVYRKNIVRVVRGVYASVR